MSIITPKRKYRVRLDYSDGARLYVYGLRHDLNSWLLSDRSNAITMLTATIASNVAHEVNRAVSHLPTTAQYAVATVEPFISRQ